MDQQKHPPTLFFKLTVAQIKGLSFSVVEYHQSLAYSNVALTLDDIINIIRVDFFSLMRV